MRAHVSLELVAAIFRSGGRAWTSGGDWLDQWYVRHEYLHAVYGNSIACKSDV